MEASAFSFFFFNDTATTEIYTLSLHDALPISPSRKATKRPRSRSSNSPTTSDPSVPDTSVRRCQSSRSEEHTSELQSQSNLVCRLLLEKKKKLITARSVRLQQQTRSRRRDV